MLKGNLRETSVISLLKLLSKAGVTGKLTLETPTSEAQVFFEQGKIIAAFLEDAKGYQALLIVSKLEEGNFSFEEGKIIPIRQFEEDTEELLNKIEEDIQILKFTSMKPILKPTDTEKIELTADEWNVIVEIPKVSNVSQIASRLGKDEIEVTKIIKALIDKKLVELKEDISSNNLTEASSIEESLDTLMEIPTSSEMRNLKEGFWKELIKEFAKIKGPIAEAIVEDTLHSIGKNFSNATTEDAKKVIKLLSEEIEDESKAVNFQKNAMEMVQKYEQE